MVPKYWKTTIAGHTRRLREQGECLMKNTEKLKRYHELFSDDAKAEAFDQLADVFYAGNFGTMSKSDIETLMFT